MAMLVPLGRLARFVFLSAIAAGCSGGSSTGTGGESGTGGLSATGGVAATGGVTATGGTLATGGTSATGGTTGAGGVTTAGGAGGSKATGGAGGAKATGGAGGARATGGSGGRPGTGGGASGGAAGGSATVGPYRFPASSTIYQDISGATVDAESTAIMNALDASGWGSGLGIDVSFNILTADAGVARRAFTSSGDEPDCDTAPIPLPSSGNIEGNPDYHCADGGDCHLLVYQGTRLYELYQADVSNGSAAGGTFTGSCEVVWDLTRDYWQAMAPPTFGRGDHCNGADAADLPMAALILTSGDVTSGEITHALRFTMPNGLIQKSVYVHPATHIGGPSGVGPTFLPYGARLRLRGDYNLSTLPSDAARTVARALQKYGMFLADGGSLYVSATVDVENVIATSSLRAIKATDFEMVDGGSRYTWSDYKCQRTPVTN
jgi:serine/threonine-protein kinase